RKEPRAVLEMAGTSLKLSSFAEKPLRSWSSSLAERGADDGKRNEQATTATAAVESRARVMSLLLSTVNCRVPGLPADGRCAESPGRQRSVSRGRDRPWLAEAIPIPLLAG